MSGEGLIGRDDVLVRKVAAKLRHQATYLGDYSDLRQTDDRRGYTFAVRLHDDDGPTGHIVRVTVELDRVEPS